MKLYNINNSYQKEALLSHFNLENNDFSNYWIESILKKPIATGIYSDNSLHDFYISYLQIELECLKQNEDYYIKLNRTVLSEIKRKGFPIPVLSGTVPYCLIRIKSTEDDNIRKYLILFISEQTASSKFDFSIVGQKDYLMRCIIEMAFKAKTLENLNTNYNVSKEFLNGNILLNTKESNRKIKNNTAGLDVLDGFEFKITYDKDVCGFTLKHQVFQKDVNTSGNTYDGITSFSNNFYKSKLDARTHARNFLDLSSSQHFLFSRFSTQIYAYTILKDVFDKLKISYEETTFKPELLFNDFYRLNNEIEHINLFMQREEYHSYDNKYKDQINMLIEYFKIKHNIEVTFKLMDSCLNEIVMNKNEAYLFLMFDPKYVKNSDTVFTEKSKWKNTISPYFELIDNTKDLNKSLSEFDLYSQFKLNSLYNIRKNGFGFLTQGCILEDNPLFSVYVHKKDSPAQEKRVFLYNDIQYIVNKKNKNKILKLINEINIKKKTFIDKEIKLEADIDSIRLVSKIVKNNKANKPVSFYSHVFMTKKDASTFNIDSAELFYEDEISVLETKHKISFNFANAKTDVFIFINDKHLIKLKDNSALPFIILDKNNFENPDLNPFIIATEDIKNGIVMSVDLLHRKSGSDKNILYPYVLPATNVLLNKSDKQSNGITKANCLIEIIDDNTIRTFMSLDENPMNDKVDKNNRVEDIQIFEYQDGEYKLVNISENMDILYVYFKSLTFDLFSINQVCKKSLLSKISEIIALN